MLKPRHRHEPDPTSFDDPLRRYETNYRSDLDRTLHEDAMESVEMMPFACVEPNTSVGRVIQLMAGLDIACVVVVRRDRPVGILSERDVLDRLSCDYDLWAGRPVSDAMTPDPVVVHETDSPAHVLNVMDVGMFRHVPIVDADGRLTGVIGARRITRYLQRHFASV
ncbi:MAG: CBS domain-containing protein [Phycisphaera sp.]|nr:CBS domain-containing protein [Phycisphaera sp.]